VQGATNSSQWSEPGAELEIVILPPWWNTWWFRTVYGLAALLVIWSAYRYRVHQIAEQFTIRSDAQVNERMRIARDLHDTLLQTIQGSKMVADAALRPSIDPTRMRSLVAQLSVWLGRATDEGREALNSLRTSAMETNDLAAAFQRSIEECRIHSSMEASFSVVGVVSEMHPIVRDEVFRIGYEAIRNASVHSKASRLQVELAYVEDLVLRVRDNGVGIDAAVVDKGKEGHFGLEGMRERALRILAKLTVETSANSGTEIKLIVPGNIIYRKATSDRKKLSPIESLLKRIGLKSNSIDS
jgi:signal transduction histidine kinase